jgi:UPF0716 protein FxsA
VGKLLLLFIAIPLIDALLLLRLGGIVGGWNTIFLVVITGFLGAWLFKVEGRRTWRAWQEALGQGRIPEEGVLSAVMLLVGGALLVTPGFVSDILGLMLLVPPIRHALARLLQPRVEAWVAERARSAVQGPSASVVYFDGIRREGDVEIVGRRMVSEPPPAPRKIIDADFDVTE